MSDRFSISKAWDQSREILARDGKLITSVALALIVLPATIGGLLAPPPTLSGEDPPSWMPIVTLIVALIGIAGQLAIVRLALGPAIAVKDAIAHGFRRLLPTFLALLLFGIAIAIVATPILLLLAGPEALRTAGEGAASPELGRAVLLVVLLVLLLAVRFQLIVPVASGESAGPIRILKRTWQVTSGNYWRLLGFLVLTLLLGFILVLFLGQVMGGILARTMFGDVEAMSVGALIAALLAAIAQAIFTAVLSVMLARIYAQLSGESAETSVPSSGT